MAVFTGLDHLLFAGSKKKGQHSRKGQHSPPPPNMGGGDRLGPILRTAPINFVVNTNKSANILSNHNVCPHPSKVAIKKTKFLSGNFRRGPTPETLIYEKKIKNSGKQAPFFWRKFSIKIHAF